MAERSEEVDERAERPVSLDLDVEDGRTEIRVTGDRDSAVVVRGESGEKIYLPPEDFQRPPADSARDNDSPYQSSKEPAASPYRSAAETDHSPYQTAPEPSSVMGIEPTPNGYVIVHPEPVTDVRFLR